ncbi:MAG: DUF262 domain-containing protein [Verrucomicrobia bacterium]|nr:DUF262 domain-containing protein [Verrucomicrobiota bacterium]
MYEIRSESLKTFISSTDIKLPRFQRKQTWKYKENFELIISVLKEYPIGVSILSKSIDVRGQRIRLLLDGRQRRNALTQFYEDPENVYDWARRYIHLSNKDQPMDINEKFWKVINDYLEDEGDENIVPEENQDEENPIDEDEENIIDENAENTNEINNEEENNAVNLADGMRLLLEIIRLTHVKRKKYSGFSAPFDFFKFLSEPDRLPYMEIHGNERSLSSKKLKKFIDDYLAYCNDNNSEYTEENNFKDFLTNRRIFPKNENEFSNYIQRNWNNIFERIDIIERINSLFTGRTIGLIEVKDLKSTDSQKIFNLINSKGTPLKAVEILSASPKWNRSIENVVDDVRDDVKDLYQKRMGIVPGDVVRWDVGATFLKRINKYPFIFKDFSNDDAKDNNKDNKSDFTNELTLSFKCLAGICTGAVTKESMEDLVNHIDWKRNQIEVIVNDINTILKLLDTSYFSFFKSWKTSLMELTTDGIALNFLILIYKKWVKLEKPIGHNQTTRGFQKDCFVLWDKLIHEYLTFLWKGSSDSRIKNNISNLDGNFTVVHADSWKVLLDSIFNNSAIGDTNISLPYMKALLYHFYCLKGLSREGQDSYDIDHIIPQSLFKGSKIPRNDVIKDNILNLGLLPKRENCSKGDRRLIEITNDESWLRDQIRRYEFIEYDLERYNRFSDITHYNEMFEFRKPIIIKAFTEDRIRILNN